MEFPPDSAPESMTMGASPGHDPVSQLEEAAEAPEALPPISTGQTATVREELHLYFATKEQLQSLRADLQADIGKSQRWTIGAILLVFVALVGIMAANRFIGG